MTDKQIIIDDQKKTIHRLQDECTEKTNAIIALGEQLKRKEQECENYKKQFKADTKEMEDYQNEIVRHLESIEYLRTQLRTKEQECERLKHDNEYEVGALEKTIDNLKADREEALKQLEFVRTLNTVKEAEIRKLSKTLTEIKEIVFPKNQLIITDSPIILKIQQKISEVEDES